MYFTGITQWYIIQTSKAKEPRPGRGNGFFAFFAYKISLQENV